MFKLLQSDQAVWMRAMTVAAVVMAIIVSGLALSPEIDHHVPPIQSAVVSAVDAGVAVEHSTLPATDTNCHFGHSCTVAIILGNQLTLNRFYTAPKRPRVMGHTSSDAGYRLFHPPRYLSQV